MSAVLSFVSLIIQNWLSLDKTVTMNLVLEIGADLGDGKIGVPDDVMVEYRDGRVSATKIVHKEHFILHMEAEDEHPPLSHFRLRLVNGGNCMHGAPKLIIGTNDSTQTAKGFGKVLLVPGKCKEINFKVDISSFYCSCGNIYLEVTYVAANLQTSVARAHLYLTKNT